MNYELFELQLSAIEVQQLGYIVCSCRRGFLKLIEIKIKI